MIVLIRLLLCLMCFAHPMLFEQNGTESDPAITDDFVEKNAYDPYAQYYKNACEGRPLCNSTIVHPTPVNTGSYKCSCNPDCSMYGDCCPDSQTNNLLNKSDDAKVFSCIPQLSFYVVKTCPTSFADTVTRMKCENISMGTAYEDTKIMRPVMDRTSRVTYLNAYCASCNNITNYEKFELSYKCASFKKMKGDSDSYVVNSLRIPSAQMLLVLAKVEFNPESKTFQAEINDTSYECFHEVVNPTHLRSHLRNCIPHLISSCPKAFNDSSVIEKCQSSSTYIVYSSAFIGNGEAYRNEYCAKCNGIESIQHCQTASSFSGSGSLWVSSSDAGTCADPQMQILPVCQ